MTGAMAARVGLNRAELTVDSFVQHTIYDRVCQDVDIPLTEEQMRGVSAQLAGAPAVAASRAERGATLLTFDHRWRSTSQPDVQFNLIHPIEAALKQMEDPSVVYAVSRACRSSPVVLVCAGAVAVAHPLVSRAAVRLSTRVPTPT